MAKWTSAIFTDIRNKLANNVIFSSWKGRPYFRKYVKPANPQTSKQTAWRAKWKEIVKRYQTRAGAGTNFESLWRAIGLEKLTSGFNAFVGEAQKGKIKCPSTGSAGVNFTVTYTLSMPAKYAELWVKDVSTGAWTNKTPAGGLTAGADQTVQINLSAGTYELWIVDTRAVDSSASEPDKHDDAAVIHWDVDEAGGTYTEAVITIS